MYSLNPHIEYTSAGFCPFESISCAIIRRFADIYSCILEPVAFEKTEYRCVLLIKNLSAISLGEMFSVMCSLIYFTILISKEVSSLNFCILSATRQISHSRNIIAEKEKRSEVIASVRAFKTAQKTLKKYYPNGFEKFDETVFDTLFKLEDENNARIFELTKKLSAAKESKNKDYVSELSEQFSALKIKRKQISAEIKKASSQNSIYHRAAKPYLDAVKLLKYKENLEHYDELLEKYNKLKQTV